MASPATPLLLGIGKTVALLLGTVAALYLLLCAWVYATQRGRIYFPTPEVDHPGAEALWLESQGERIKVWAVSRPGPRALIYFGGNADDAAAHIDLFAAALPEHSLYLVNYRGYGGSSGRPSESGLAADARAVYDHVRKAHPHIAVVGRSLGSGVAVCLAGERPVERLVLVTPFDSLVNLAKTYFGWLPVGLLLQDRYDSARRGDRGRGRDHSAGTIPGTGRQLPTGTGAGRHRAGRRSQHARCLATVSRGGAGIPRGLI
jgi:pimeloyl-ACP methyl ester carboxylesterase